MNPDKRGQRWMSLTHRFLQFVQVGLAHGCCNNARFLILPLFHLRRINYFWRAKVNIPIDVGLRVEGLDRTLRWIANELL